MLLRFRMKYETYSEHADAVYECDDKCGSFWQQLPGDAEGRDGKATARAKYVFAIQANVVVGPGGVQRFTVVPKNICTGANFGCTNFVMALVRAKRAGRLHQGVKKVIRHTDGGPDNVAIVTHLLHFLLVYIGAFEELLWILFESGHSHTEIADRLFHILKLLFKSETGVRVQGVEDFAQLEARLHALFASSREMFELGWLFANWDFGAWFDSMHVVDPDFGRFSFDKVWRYEYVGRALWQHGGVRVTYKDRLSWMGSSTEAQWKPIQRATRRRPSMSGGSEDAVEVNETTPEGVLFVVRPPDLRREPQREDLDANDDAKLAPACERILRRDDLSEDAMAFWEALRQIHASYGHHSGAAPTLPTSKTVNGRTFTFDGCPQPLLPLLKELIRFPRPLITWDLFNDESPSEFADAAPSEDAGDSFAAGGSTRDGLRDPRRVNHVTHGGHTQAAQRRDQAAVRHEDWIADFQGRVEKVEGGKLYIMRLDEADGRYFLGLAMAEGKVFTKRDENGKESSFMKVLWFKRSNDAQPGWGKNPAFEEYESVVDRKRERISDDVPVESFLVEVLKGHLTDKCTEARPKLKQDFMMKLHEVAERNGLVHAEAGGD